jgi:hydrogenase maturation protein HypF
MSHSQERVRIRFRGAVQGVGFRPFLHGLAALHGVSGFVLNDADGVLAEFEGTALDAFVATLNRERPPLARIDFMDVTRLQLERQHGFAIRQSEVGEDGNAQAGADAAPVAPASKSCSTPSAGFTCTHLSLARIAGHGSA